MNNSRLPFTKSHPKRLWWQEPCHVECRRVVQWTFRDGTTHDPTSISIAAIKDYYQIDQEKVQSHFAVSPTNVNAQGKRDVDLRSASSSTLCHRSCRKEGINSVESAVQPLRECVKNTLSISGGGVSNVWSAFDQTQQRRCGRQPACSFNRIYPLKRHC